MKSFVQGLLHRLEAPLAKGLLQDAFLLWLKFDCHYHTPGSFQPPDSMFASTGAPSLGCAT